MKKLLYSQACYKISLRPLLIAIVLIITQTISFSEAYAKDIDNYPSAITSFTGGATVCQNFTLTLTTVISIGTISCGTGHTTTYLPITVNWYDNGTTNSTTGGTLVYTQNSTTATNTFTFSPSTSSAGLHYYYCKISWAAGICATAGSLTTPVTQAVNVNAIAPPTAPDVSRCDPGIITLNASGGSYSNYIWYDAASGGNIVGTSPSYVTPPISTTTPYYVSSAGWSSVANLSSGLTGNRALVASSFAAFNVTNNSSKPLVITQLSCRVNEGGVSRNFQVYYRNGTYSGNESTAANWIQAGGTYTITTATIGTPTIINVTDFAIPPGQVTGIYIFTSSQMVFLEGTAPNVSNANITISGGSVQGALSSPFTGTAISNNGFQGSVYYQTADCESARILCQAIISSGVTPGLSVTANPGNIICSGTSVTFTATPENGGSPPAYQWQLNGSNVMGQTASTYTHASLTDGNTISCVLTSSLACASPSTATSNVITMSVRGTATINTQPVNSLLCQNGNTSFSVEAVPAGPYQWQVSTNNGTSWSNITEAGTGPSYAGWGTSTLSLTAATGSNNNNQYRCLVGCTPSNAALLNVNPAKNPVPVNNGSCIAPANLILTATGAVAGEKYLWYDAAIGGILLKVSSDYLDNTYTAMNVSATTDYYVGLTTPDGCKTYPLIPITATIYTTPAIMTPPSNVTRPVGSSTSFNVDATGSLLTYQWQVNAGSGFVNITSAGTNPVYSGWNTPTLVLNGVVLINHGFQYRCVVGGACSPAVTSPYAILSIGDEAPGGPYFHPTVGIQYTYLGTCMVATDGGNYYDNGGSTNDYANDINYIYRTFCPNTAHKAMKAVVNRLQIEYTGGVCKDALFVQNGPNQAANILWEGCGNSDLPNILSVAGNYNGGVFTSTHISGCLTFRFTSDASNSGSWDGWDIALSLVDFASGPSGSANTDCANSTPICSDITASSFTYGPGLVSDACTGCVTSENFVEWYRIRMASGGTLELEIVPNGVCDLDFALYSSDECGILGDPIRCSYAARTSPGKTGMRIGASDLAEDVFGDQWVKEVTAGTGETFYLLINEWNKPNPNQYTLDWTLTNGASFDCQIVLPIELLTFKSICVNQHTVLNWTTGTETNNDRFIVLKSENYTDFKPIGFLDGAGNSNELRHYTFTDPVINEGTTYYKIQQVDYDGKFSFSDVISSACEGPKSEAIIVENFQDQGYINLKFPVIKGQTYKMHLIDLGGRVVFVNDYSPETDQGDLNVSTSRLAPGIYQISINSNQNILKARVMIY